MKLELSDLFILLDSAASCNHSGWYGKYTLGENFDLETIHFSLLQGGWVGWRIFAPDDHMVLRWDREGISHHWQSVKGDYTEKFLACKFSKKVAKLASQNIPYTYFMFTSYLTGK